MIKTRRGGEATQRFPRPGNHYHTKQIEEMSTEPRNLRKEVAPAGNWKNTLRNTEREKKRSSSPFLPPVPPSRASHRTDLVEEG